MSKNRGFRNDRMRVLYERAIEAGWKEKTNSDSMNHVQLVAPDDPMTVMVMSKTAVATGRSVLNTEAVFKRWQRERGPNRRIAAAIEVVELVEKVKASGGEPAFPVPPNQEDVDRARRVHLGDKHALGNWRTVEDPERFHIDEHHGPGTVRDHSILDLRGSQRRAERTEREANEEDEPDEQPLIEEAQPMTEPQPHDLMVPPMGTFTVEEVMTVAAFGAERPGTGDPFITLNRLREGLNLVAKMRGPLGEFGRGDSHGK